MFITVSTKPTASFDIKETDSKQEAKANKLA